MANEPSDLLKLAALDADDLSVVSAHVQDAAVRVDGIDYDPSAGRVLIAMNRFAWEAPTARRWFQKRYQRRNAVLHFERVGSVQRLNVPTADTSAVLALLSVTFQPDSDDGQTASPDGTIEITFSGGAGLRLAVEAVEARLTDLGAAWATAARPRHV